MGSRIISLSSINNFFQDDLRCIKRGENSLNSGDMIYCEVEDNVIRGVVAASMRNKNYNVRVTLATDHSICNAECNCPRGKFVCHHMACVILHVHYNLSRTDVSCSWVRQPEKPSTSSAVVPETIFQPVDDADLLEVEAVESFREDLRAIDHNSGLLWLMTDPPEAEDEFLVPSVESILYCKDYVCAEDKIEYLKHSLQLEPAKIISIAATTVLQRDNSAWLIARKHRLTASNFGEVLGACRRNSFPKSLFDRLKGSYDLDGVRAVQWGRQNEKLAIFAFETAEKQNVIQTGLWLMDCGYLGASPDGLIEPNGIVEVKCPYKYRDNILKEKLQKSYIIWWENGEYKVNVSHNYYHQIQGQLYCTQRDFCKLVIYTKVDLAIVTILKDPQWVENITILEKFYIQQYIKHILE